MNLRKLSDIVDLLKGKKPEISTNSDGNLPYLTAKYIRGNLIQNMEFQILKVQF